MGWQLNLKDRYKDFLDKFMDKITMGLKSINTDHNAIHSGLGFCLDLYHPSLAEGEKKIYRFEGPENLYAHIKSIQVSLIGSTCRVRLIKEPTIITPGIQEVGVITNLNHNSDIVPQSKVFDGSVEYTDGQNWCSIIIHADTSGAGVTLLSTSGNFIQNEYLEYITKNGNENYILEIENIGTDPALHIDIQMFFYEEKQGLIKLNGQ